MALSTERLIEEVILCDPALLKYLVREAIKKGIKAGEYGPELLEAFDRVEQETEMTAKSSEAGTERKGNTMNAYGAGIGVQRLADAGLVTKDNTRVRPRSWSTKYFAIEVSVEGPSEWDNANEYTRKYGFFDYAVGRFRMPSSEKSKTVTKLYNLDDVDAYIAANKPKPVEVVGIFRGNNKFMFPIGGMGSMQGFVTKSHKADGQDYFWTLSEIRSTNGEVQQDGVTYSLVAPRDLFRTKD